MPGGRKYGICVRLASALLLVSSCLTAQVRPDARIRLPIEEANDLVFVRVPFGNGSVHATVAQIAEDQLGFLWFGTDNGLKRFDGYRLRDFQPEPGNPYTMNGREINPLFNDRSGKLWVASNLSVVRYDPVMQTFAHYSSDPSLLEGPIHDVYQDRAGAIWLATANGLTSIDLQTGEKRRYLGQLINILKSTFEENDGTFWVADKESVEVFDRRTGEITRRLPLRDAAAVQSGRSTNQSVHLLEDHAGVLWVASERDGLARVDRRNNRLTYFALAPGADPDLEPGACTLLEDEQGVLWVGTKSGLFRLDRDRSKFIRYRNKPDDPNSLSADYVLALFEDQEGGIWVGTDHGGVARFSSRPTFQRYSRRPANSHDTRADYVSSVYQDRLGNIWMGGKGILNRIDRETGLVISYPLGGVRGRFSNADVLSIVEDVRGKLWLAAWGGGVHRFDPRTEAWKTYRHKGDNPSSLGQDSVFTLFIDHRGRLWVGTENGLNAFDLKTERFQVYRIPEFGNNRERAIAEDSQGALWLATLHTGLHRFDPVTRQFTVYRHSEAAGSLSNDAVSAIYIDHTGAVWAGTANGLNRFDAASAKFTAYYERNGLAGDSVTGIQEDQQGDLWVTTNNGLSRFDRGAGAFQNYYPSDGVPSDLTSIWKGRTGEMFVGSFGGLVRFFPDRVSESNYVPQVILTDFQLNDMPARIGGESPLQQSISVTKSLTLFHNQPIFSLEFAALSYANPSQTRYRYKLEGFEPEWHEVDASRRAARYTTLAPGGYVFRVQSRTNRGAWSEKGAAVRIQIMPPWWGTWWFRTACVALILILLWYAHYFRIRQLAWQFNLRLEERVGERTRIARELHDTLLQSLHGLMFRFQAARNMLPRRPEEAIQTLDGALTRTEQAIAESRNAIQDLRSEPLAGNDLTHLVNALGQELVGSKDTSSDWPTFRVIVEGAPQSLHPVLQDEIYAIAREALRNAFRHAHARAIEAEIKYSNDLIRLRIRDDGKGITPDVLKEGGLAGHWGLPGLRERAKAIGAGLDFWSEVGVGTEVELTVPNSAAYARSHPRGGFWLFRNRRRTHERHSSPD